jgi:hypothetical protein
VIAPANTGKESKSKTAVIKIDQANSGVLCKFIPIAFIFKIVVIKLIAETKLEVPAKCKEKIAMSTDPPLWPLAEESRG